MAQKRYAEGKLHILELKTFLYPFGYYPLNDDVTIQISPFFWGDTPAWQGYIG